MRIVCWQTLFLLKIEKDVAKFVVCCSRDWCFKVKQIREKLYRINFRQHNRLDIQENVSKVLNNTLNTFYKLA